MTIPFFFATPCQEYSMKKHSSTKAYLAAAAAILLCGTSAGASANEATDAIDTILQKLKDLGATEASYVQLVGQGDTGASLSGAKVSIPVTFALVDGGTLKATIEASVPTVELEGLSLGTDGVEIERWTSPGTIEFTVTGAVEEKGKDGAAGETTPFRVTAKESNVVSTGNFLPFFSLPDEDPQNPVSRYFEWIRTALKARTDYTSIGRLETAIDKTKLNSRSVEIYEQIEISGLLDGRIDDYRTASFTSIQSLPAQSGANGEDLELSQRAKSSRIVGLNYKPILQAYGIVPAGGDSDGSVLEEGEVNGLSYEFPNGSASVRRIALEEAAIDPDVEPFDLGKMLDDLALGQLADTEEAQKDIARRLFAVLGAFSFGRAEVDRIDFDTPLLKGAIDRIEGRDMSFQGVDRFSVTGLSAEGPGFGVMELGLFKIDRLLLADLPAYVDLGFAAGKNGEPDIADILPILPTLGGLELAGLRVAPDGAGIEVALERYLLEMSDFIDAVPTKLRSETRGLRLPVTAVEEAEVGKLLEASGLKDIVYDGKQRIGWDEATGDLTLDELSMTLKGGATVNASLTLGGIPRRIFERPDQFQAALATATVKSGKITISDAAIVTALIEDQAKAAQISPETMAFALADEARNNLGPLQSTKFGEDLHKALKGFLSKPERIELVIAPERPVSFFEIVGLAISAPQQIPEKLGLRLVNDKE